jgi:hypothetical protein
MAGQRFKASALDPAVYRIEAADWVVVGKVTAAGEVELGVDERVVGPTLEALEHGFENREADGPVVGGRTHDLIERWVAGEGAASKAVR